METTIFNLDITLNEEQTKLLNSLSRYTNYSVEELITDIATGKDTWEDYEDLLEHHEFKNSPSSKGYTTKEVEECIRTRIYPH